MTRRGKNPDQPTLPAPLPLRADRMVLLVPERISGGSVEQNYAPITLPRAPWDARAVRQAWKE